MVAVPSALLDILALDVGTAVELTVGEGCLVIRPQLKPGYALAELLAASTYSQPQTDEEREWVDAPAIGGELV